MRSVFPLSCYVLGMTVGVYAHPWNVGQENLKRWQGLGVTDVAMAVSYHAGRWLAPDGEGSLVRFLEDGVVHFAPGNEYGEVRPVPSSAVDAGSPLQQFLTDCQASGVEGHAWTVLFHNSRLGALHPELCVHNALGDAYTWALCPSQPAVREYGLALLRDLARHDGLHTIELEAAGFFGHRHSSHHDKSAFVSDPYLDFLLSYCFCPACVADLQASGVDGAAAKEHVAKLLGRALVEGDAMQASCFTHLSPNEDVPPALLASLQQRRTQSLVGLLQKFREVVPAGIKLTAHLVPDPMFSGSQLGVEPAMVEELLDGMLLTHYGQDAKAIRKAWEGWRYPQKETDNDKVRVCVWPKAPQFVLDEDLHEVKELVQELGLAGVRIYHAGLLPKRTLDRAITGLI